jgi:hypothetical protein
MRPTLVLSVHSTLCAAPLLWRSGSESLFGVRANFSVGSATGKSANMSQTRSQPVSRGCHCKAT